MGFEGAKYTWTRGLSSDTYNSDRLDRGLCNLEWKEMFPEANVIHQPIIQSDHSSLLIKLFDRKQLGCKWGYRFQVAWLTHENFPDVITEEWDIKEPLEDNIVKMANVLPIWNKTTFGDIHRNKRRLIARIEGIQRSLNIQPSRGLIKLEKRLRDDLDMVLQQEELLWYQKLREYGLYQGTETQNSIIHPHLHDAAELGLAHN
ncbi:uncharacterized protein [Primulina huaijiensis]|uniref:uncharacterized protein n=1 Tax=Primulina huaijiensis TaxID=1492673 RepID=UPI003CC6FA93